MPSIRYETSGAVGHIILCDPPHNFLNVDFNDQLRDAVTSATADDLRAVLVRAEGPNFCSGGDPEVLPKMNLQAFRPFIAEFNRTYRALEALPVPTVAAVRGNVFGGGVELVLSCDFIVAAQDATIRQVEVSLGSMPMAGGVQRMADRIGRTRAALYAMLTLPMTGETAGELGLASFVVPEEEVESKALDLVQELANGPTLGYAAVRQILKAWSAGGVPGARRRRVLRRRPVDRQPVELRRGSRRRVGRLEQRRRLLKVGQPRCPGQRQPRAPLAAGTKRPG
jgi:enoyl-CoA hydratase/carnithine racemase